MRNILKLIFGDRRKTKCAYAHMYELSQWESRPRGPEHIDDWFRQLDYITANPDTNTLRVINVDKAIKFIKDLNGVT